MNEKNCQTEMNHVDKSDLDSTDGDGTAHMDEDKVEQENYRKRKLDTPSKLEKELVHSQNKMKSLKKHLERKTRPKSLQYRARACIKADSDLGKTLNVFAQKLRKTMYKPL